MRLRITQPPTGNIDGITLDHFRWGQVYELSPTLASLFLSKGWAEPAPLVLLVDDQDEVRQLTARVLKVNGYDVIEALDGGDALSSLCRYAPDLVILDLNMPLVDGWQFREEQQRLADERLAAIPVLLMTGEEDAADHAAKLQAVGLVKKPFEVAHFLRAVERALPS
jgi:CheY-like chemotaxis protein